MGGALSHTAHSICGFLKAFVMATPQEELEALLAAPSLPAPEGVTPNFDNPPNRNGLAYFVTTFCIFVATLCLILRAYIRTWKEKRLYKEEGKDPAQHDPVELGP